MVALDLWDGIIDHILDPPTYRNISFLSRWFRKKMQDRKEKDMLRIGSPYPPLDDECTRECRESFTVYCCEEHDTEKRTGWFLPNGKKHGIHCLYLGKLCLWNRPAPDRKELPSEACIGNLRYEGWDGECRMIKTWRNGMAHGTMQTFRTLFSIDGADIIQGQYVNGKREGVWTYINQDDGRVSERTWTNGVSSGSRPVIND